MTTKLRTESDSMGNVEVPENALYGASTQRAVQNFPISGEPVDPSIIKAYGLIKWAAAKSNASLGEITPNQAELIEKAALEISNGELEGNFPVDTYQTGSGTSTNMNVNEVIANRCSQYLDEPLSGAKTIHPNDHINKGQSSNDTFPTSIHIAATINLKNDLIPALEILHRDLKKNSQDFSSVRKIGRTHLMDATPITLGDEFSAYAEQINLAISRAHKAIDALLDLPLGGTAVGTGLNCHPDFPQLAIQYIAEKTEIPFRETTNHFEAQAAKDALVECHGQLNTIATSLFKIANDIRIIASGPRCGIGEISLPAIQPGSSIMPGKVNPVICEAVTMVAARVFGNQTTVTWCGANGQLELNVFMPLIAKCVLESIRLLSNVSETFATSCVRGIQPNVERCEELIEKSLSMVTPLVPIIGYDRAAKIAKESAEKGITIRELCETKLQELDLTQQQLDEALNS